MPDVGLMYTAESRLIVDEVHKTAIWQYLGKAKPDTGDARVTREMSTWTVRQTTRGHTKGEPLYRAEENGDGSRRPS